MFIDVCIRVLTLAMAQSRERFKGLKPSLWILFVSVTSRVGETVELGV